MKNSLFLILAILLWNCKSQQSLISDARTYENFRGFEPIDPTEHDAKVEVVENKSIILKNVKLLSQEEIFSFLSNETVLVSIGKIDAEGGISYLPITLSAKGSNYKITMDYMKFATIGQVDEAGKFIGYKRVGVGLRLISQITTFESGINIGDLTSIGIAAKTGKLNGTLMIEVIGIKSKDITNLLPLPSEINQSTIQSAMQALATIKSKIYDKETNLFPQVIAVKEEKRANENGTVKAKENKEDTKVKLQFENNPTQTTNLDRVNEANKLVEQAFAYLFSKDVDNAILTFDQCEKVYPQFYSVYEINQLLKSNRENLKDKNSAKWSQISSTLLERYSWKLSDDIKTKLKSLSERNNLKQ